jgi:hypothetical protein
MKLLQPVTPTSDSESRSIASIGRELQLHNPGPCSIFFSGVMPQNMTLLFRGWVESALQIAGIATLQTVEGLF